MKASPIQAGSTIWGETIISDLRVERCQTTTQYFVSHNRYRHMCVSLGCAQVQVSEESVPSGERLKGLGFQVKEGVEVI